jgi:hypothetical protein
MGWATRVGAAPYQGGLGLPVTAVTNPDSSVSLAVNGVLIPNSIKTYYKLAVFGDSILSEWNTDKSACGHLNAACFSPFLPSLLAAVGGTYSDTIRNSVLSNLTATGVYDAALIGMGTNNYVNYTTRYPSSTYTTATLQANAAVTEIISDFKIALAQAKTKVAYVFALGMHPVDATAVTSATLRQVPLRVNALLEDYCRANGICYLDMFSSCVDPTDGITAIATRMYDTIHPGRNGAADFAQKNKSRVKAFVGINDTYHFGSNANGSFDYDSTAKRLSINGMMYGASSANLVNGVTGLGPLDIYVKRPATGSGSTATCVSSMVAANIGGGQAVRLTMTNLVAGDQYGIALYDVNGTGFVGAGDSYYVEAFVKTSGAYGVLNGMAIFGHYTQTGGAAAGPVQADALQPVSSGDIYDSDIAGILFRSKILTMPTDATSIVFDNFAVQCIAAANGSCTMDIEKMAIVKI